FISFKIVSPSVSHLSTSGAWQCQTALSSRIRTATHGYPYVCVVPFLALLPIAGNSPHPLTFDQPMLPYHPDRSQHLPKVAQPLQSDVRGNKDCNSCHRPALHLLVHLDIR